MITPEAILAIIASTSTVVVSITTFIILVIREIRRVKSEVESLITIVKNGNGVDNGFTRN